MTTRPLWQNTCSCCGCMLREAAVAEAAGMKVFPSFSGSVNASKTNVERKREIGKERDGEKDKRQDSKTKQQKT